MVLFYQNTSKHIRKYMGASLKNMFACLDFKMFVNVGKDGHRQMPKIRLIKSGKSWIWDQCLLENTNGFFGKFPKP